MNAGVLSGQGAAQQEAKRSQLPTPWRQVWPGVVFFLLSGSGLLVMEMPPDWVSMETRNLLFNGLWLGGYLLVLVGALIGWLQGFPRWSYPYVAYSVVVAMLLPSGHTYGLVIFGVPVWGEEAWGLRACLPLLVVFLIGLAITRGKPSLPSTFVKSWFSDGSQLSFAFYGLLPIIFSFSLEEVGNKFGFPAFSIGLLLAMVGALVYLRAASRRIALIALFAGTFISVYTANLFNKLYWAMYEIDTTTLERWRKNEPLEFEQILLQPIKGALIVCAIMVILLLAREFFLRQAQNLPAEDSSE